MSIRPEFWIYLFVMAGVTYLVRTLPLLLVKNKIKNRFVLSFLHYMPYAVLTAMTVPAIFHATGSVWSALAGFIVGFLFAYFEKSLVTVAIFTALTVLLVDLGINYIPLIF
jgi:branched-subunit amino acid transport protein